MSNFTNQFKFRPLDEIWSTKVSTKDMYKKKKSKWFSQEESLENKAEELDLMMKKQEEDLVKTLDLNLDDEPTLNFQQRNNNNLTKEASFYDSLFDLNFDKQPKKEILEYPVQSHRASLPYLPMASKKFEEKKKIELPPRRFSKETIHTSKRFSNLAPKKIYTAPYGEGKYGLRGRNSRGDMRKYSSTSSGKETYQLRSSYLGWCDHFNVTPAPELLKSLKNSLRNQTPFARLSICHAGIDNTHVRVIVNTLDSNPCVNEILLNHNKISDEGANILARSLKSNKNITSVELFGNKISDDSQKEFADMLTVNTTLKRLKLGDNSIGPRGAALLSKGLKQNTSLTQLHLGGNKIQVEGLEHVAEALKGNTTLTSLGLRDNAVGPKGMKALSDTLKEKTCALSDIQLKGNRISAQGAAYLANAIQVNKSLKVLELQSNSIGHVGVNVLCKALKQNKSVHALNFNENELGDEGAGAVARLLMENPSITTLGLANNRIRKKGAQYLAEALKSSNSTVTGLDLGNNELGNGGAVSLASALKFNNVLTSLDLRSCEIHLKGVLSLADMCSVNKTLRHLDLGANYAKNQGAISWSQVLSRNKTLTRLCLTDNQIYNEGGESLARAMQKNFTLRNFSYGGQGPSANRIDSTIRRVIDSIVTENKRTWEASNGKTTHKGLVFSPRKMSPRLIKGSRKIDISNIRYNRSRNTLKKNGKFSYGLPNWFTSYERNPKAADFDSKLAFQLSYLFQKNLLKAENPKFPGCYFIGHIANTLSKIFPESNIDETQLVYFAYNNSNYYVHLSPEMVKTQIKYVGTKNQQNNRNTLLRNPRGNSYKTSNTKKVFQKNSLNSQSRRHINNRSSNNRRGMYANEQRTTLNVNGFPSLNYKQPKTFMRSKRFGAIGDERKSYKSNISFHPSKNSTNIDFNSLEESLKNIKF